MTSTTAPATVAALDRAAAAEAAGALRPCCASERWISAVTAGRPYGALAALQHASALALADLGWSDIEQALAAHPRIGDRAVGAGTEAAWSRGEQSGTAGIGAQLQSELRDGNVAYEQRFGHVFLICATGLSAADMLSALHDRLGHRPEDEHEVVRGELQAIVALRLAKAFGP